MIVSLQKKTKTEFYSEDKKKNIYSKKKKKNIPKISKRFLSKFCYRSEIWHSVFKLISASDILHLFLYFLVSGRLEHNKELHNHPKSRIFHWQLPQLVLIIGLFFYLIHNFFRLTFAGVAFVIMGTFCFDDNFVFSFQDCGTF